MTQHDVNTDSQSQTGERLTEQFNDWYVPEVVVDATARLIRNVALAGIESRNGYRYSEQALRTAVALYVNKPVFLDHAANLARPQERSARDLVGSIVEPRFEEGRIRGDIQVVDTEAGRTFLALASANTPGVGMSHVVLVRKNSQGDVVEEIQDVVSVDAVAFPATTISLRENQHAPDNESTETQQTSEAVSQWKAALDEIVLHWPLVQQLLGVSQEGRPSNSPVGESIRTTEADVDRLLKNSGLPPFAVSESFRQCLLETSDADIRRALCADRLQLIEAARRLLPASRERLRTAATNDELSILSTFRRQSTSVLAGYG